MDEAVEAEIRRQWGGDANSSWSELGKSEMVRIVAGAGTMAKNQVDRLDRFSLPLSRLNEYAERASAALTAWRFLDQVRSDYRRVSPRLDLAEVEMWRESDEGVRALLAANVENRSVGVLAVGELLDTNSSIRTLKPWMSTQSDDEASSGPFISSFGDVLGPIVQVARFPNSRTDVPWAEHVGYEWASEFLAAGAHRLSADTRPTAVRLRERAAAVLGWNR